jgi:hypothetical protein
MKEITKFCDELTNDIKKAYEESVGIDEAERLAAKFLDAQIQVGNELRLADLDARMKKTGLKAVKAAAYMEAATKGEKKPTEAFIEATINRDEVVSNAQEMLDTAECRRDAFSNYLSVFREAHIYFRGIAKGRFE